MTDFGSRGEKRGWFQRLTEGLSRSSRQFSDQVVSTFTRRPLDQRALDELEEMLIEADLGPAAAGRVTEAFARERFGREASEGEIKQALAEAVAAELKDHEGRFEPLSGPRPYVVLFVGVNGSGKTTTLGKIAADLRRRGARVMMVAGDTFRAAAVEQLKVWADRAGAEFVSGKPQADPAGLAFDALARAQAEGFDVVLVDTAGPLPKNREGVGEGKRGDLGGRPIFK